MKKLSLILCALVALMIAAACGPSDPNTNGTGGHGSSTASITGVSGGGGTTSNGGGGTGGDVNVCHTSVIDPFATEDPTCEVCTCNVTPTTDEAFCQLWRSQGVELCPPGGNTCEPGINMCGFNLPEGQPYELPDPQCKLFVRGDTWTDENFNSSFIGANPPQYDPNGQLQMGGLISSSTSYYEGFIMSGRALYWNRRNAQTADNTVCTFSADCKTLSCVDAPSGTTRMYWWQNHPGS